MPYFFSFSEQPQPPRQHPAVQRNEELRDVFKRSEARLTSMYKQQARIPSPASQLYRARLAEAIGMEMQRRIEEDMPPLRGVEETQAERARRQGRQLSVQEKAALKKTGINQRAQNGIDVICKSGEYRRAQAQAQARRQPPRPAEVWREAERPKYTLAPELMKRSLEEQARVRRLPVSYSVIKEDIVPEMAPSQSIQHERQLRLLENTLSESEIRQKHFDMLSQAEQRAILDSSWSEKAIEALRILESGYGTARGRAE